MPSYGNQVAPRDKTQHASVRFGDGEPLEVDFYANRITGKSAKLHLNGAADEMTDGEVQNVQQATDLCSIVATWNLTGPVTDDDGKQLVAEQETVPLDPQIVVHLSLPFRSYVLTQIFEAALPNSRNSRRLRRQ